MRAVLHYPNIAFIWAFACNWLYLRVLLQSDQFAVHVMVGIAASLPIRTGEGKIWDKCVACFSGEEEYWGWRHLYSVSPIHVI